MNLFQLLLLCIYLVLLTGIFLYNSVNVIKMIRERNYLLAVFYGTLASCVVIIYLRIIYEGWS